MNSRIIAVPVPRGPIMGRIAIGTMGLLLGFIPLLKSYIDKTCNCSEIVTIRIAVAFIAAGLFVGCMVLMKKPVGRFLFAREHFKLFTLYGMMCVVAVYYFYLKSLEFTTPSIAITTLFAVTPLTGYVVSLGISSEIFSWKKTGCILGMIVGCSMVTFENLSGSEQNHLWGIVCAMISGACYGMFGVIGEKLKKNYEYPVMSFWQFAFALAAMLGLSVIFDGHEPLRWSIIASMSEKEIIGSLGLGIVCTFIPYLLYSYGIRHVEASTASALSLLEAVSCCLVAYLFMGENLSLLQTLGIVVVITISVLLPKTRKESK